MKYFALLSLCVLQSAIVTAHRCESVRGIYNTAEEFIKDSLSFSNNCRVNSSIRLNDFFNNGYVSVKQHGNILKLSKYTIFGYKTCSNKVYRFKGKTKLLLLNAGEPILIYKHITSKPPLGRTNVTNYYFSISPHSTVELLTIKNFKSAFSDNVMLQQFVDEYFKYNTDLAKGDMKNNSFLINKLYRKSFNGEN